MNIMGRSRSWELNSRVTSNPYRRIEKYEILKLLLMTASIFNNYWWKVALQHIILSETWHRKHASAFAKRTHTWTTSETLSVTSSFISDPKDDTYSANHYKHSIIKKIFNLSLFCLMLIFNDCRIVFILLSLVWCRNYHPRCNQNRIWVEAYLKIQSL